LPTFDGVQYKRTFLKQVIARLDFVSPLTATAATLPTPLSQEIMKRFPIPEPGKAVAQELQISAPQGLVGGKRTEHSVWTFHSKERDKKLALHPAALILEIDRYQTYEVLKSDFVPVVAALLAAAQEAQPSRLGLRYINLIALDGDNPFDWDGLINAQLLHTLKVPSEGDRDKLARAFNIVDLALDDFNLRYQFGMSNPDYPAKIRRRMFVVDLDGYVQGALDKNEIEHLLDTFHSKIQEYFEFSITNELRERMNA